MSIPNLRGVMRIGAYEVLGDGRAVPWGTAYPALDSRSDREVVLQIIPPSRQGPDEGEVPWEVLLAETAALERLYHPGLPAVLEIAHDEDDLLVAFAATPGRTLAEALAAGSAGSAGLRADRDRLVDWGCQLLDMLAEAHAHGLLHRHLGEGEVIVGTDGRLTVTGFGLTRMSFEPPGSLAPEMRSGAPATRRSDLYAVGALLRRIVRQGRGPRLAPETGDDPLARFLARATAFDPAARFASAVQMAEELAGLAGGGR